MSRRAVEELARREHQDAAEKGKPISADEAKRRAVKTAHEAERDRAGLTTKYRDGERP